MGNCSADNVKQSPLQSALSGMVGQLKMTTYTDKTNALSLFNYESDKLHKHTYHIIDSCIIFKAQDHKKHIRAYENSAQNEENEKDALFTVRKKHNYFKITPFGIENNETLIQKSLWLVVRSLPEKKHHIRQKDVIKFGKQKVKVRQIIMEDHHLHNAIIDLTQMNVKNTVYNSVKYTENQQNIEPNLQVKSIISEENCTCRICLEPGQKTNPLICPCKCIGTVRYVHIKCLRAWLNTRLNVQKIQNIIVVKWTPITCEICKNHFKYRVFLDNIKYYTLEIPKPTKPYMVLQVVGKTAQFSKIFLFVTFLHKKEMSIGRQKTSDIQIKDISMSRHHSNIFYDQIEKKFYVTDNQSKYGTFIYIKKNMLVNPHQKHISFQIGGELYSFQAFRRSEPYNEYHEQQRYLNLIEKGNENCLSSESSQNEEQHEEIQDEISSEQEEEIKAQDEVKLKKNISNISSIPISGNLPELDYHSSTTSPQRHQDDLRIVEANMALNSNVQ